MVVDVVEEEEEEKADLKKGEMHQEKSISRLQKKGKQHSLKMWKVQEEEEDIEEGEEVSVAEEEKEEGRNTKHQISQKL